VRAPIEAINAVRKHLSAVKGGRFAATAHKATKITLAVSDVPMGKESALASGPTMPDPTTVADAKRIIAEYSLYDRFSPALRRWLDEGKMPETPKANDAVFRNAHFFLLLEWMICFIRRIMRRKRRDSSPAATIRPMTG